MIFIFDLFGLKEKTMKKKLAILLPSKPKFPIGGYKVAYQYADFFAEIGYDVSVAYECVHIDFFKRKDISAFFITPFIIIKQSFVLVN